MVHTKNTYEITKKLIEKHPWIEARFEGLMNLLYKDCSEDAEKKLVYTLINNIRYVDANEYSSLLVLMADTIVSMGKSTDTIVYATAHNRDIDSSQEIVYRLKSLLSERGWIKPRAIARIDKLDNIKDGDNIIIVDEFIGSGQTMLNRYRTVSKYIEDKKKSNCNIFIFAIIATKEGYNHLTKQGVNVQTCIDLPRGISDNYESYTEQLDIMLNLESKVLASKIEEFDLPQLGYGRSEALYKRENGNTPNNVFPIFWWPLDDKMNSRNTLMDRGM